MIDYDEIGRIVDQPGEYDEDGMETKAPTFHTGWFVNATELDPALAEFQIFPETPTRVFAGCETIFLRFDSQEQWTEKHHVEDGS